MPLIGIISDTHGLLRPEALSLLEGVECIVHAGDIGGPEIVAMLAKIAPVTAIRGNVDRAPWARAFPETACVDWQGRRFLVVHDRNAPGSEAAADGCDAVISGHSHRAGAETVGGVLYLNPGSAGPRRFNLPITLATLRLAGNALVPTIHRIG